MMHLEEAGDDVEFGGNISEPFVCPSHSDDYWSAPGSSSKSSPFTNPSKYDWKKRSPMTRYF